MTYGRLVASLDSDWWHAFREVRAQQGGAHDLYDRSMNCSNDLDRCMLQRMRWLAHLHSLSACERWCEADALLRYVRSIPDALRELEKCAAILDCPPERVAKRILSYVTFNVCSGGGCAGNGLCCWVWDEAKYEDDVKTSAAARRECEVRALRDARIEGMRRGYEIANEGWYLMRIREIPETDQSDEDYYGVFNDHAEATLASEIAALTRGEP